MCLSLSEHKYWSATLGRDSTFIKSLQCLPHTENPNRQTVNLSHYFYRICSSSIYSRALHGMETDRRTFDVSTLIYLHTYLTMLTYTNDSADISKEKDSSFRKLNTPFKTAIHYYNTGSLWLISFVFIWPPPSKTTPCWPKACSAFFKLIRFSSP